MIEKLLKNSRQLKPTKSKHGFTLIEVMTVLVVLTVMIGAFYSFFFINWKNYSDHIARTALWHDARRINQEITNDVRQAATVNVINTPEQSVVQLFNRVGVMTGRYTMSNDSTLTMDRGLASALPISIVMTRNLNHAGSSFVSSGKGLVVNLAFVDQVFTRQINVSTSTEVTTRN